MALSDFIMLAATCAPAVHPTTISAIITQESQGNIYAIGVNGNYKLPRQPSTLEEAVTMAQQLKNAGYNFDVGLGQINIKNLEWLKMSLSDLFDPCKNLKALQAVLVDCYKRALSTHSAGQAALRAALSCYNTGNFKRGLANGYVQKVSSHVDVNIPALVPVDEKKQKTVQHYTTEKEHAFKAAIFVQSREELTDAFTGKVDNVSDVFTATDIFSSGNNRR
ncbi:lytic transglycosylase domain-containing protein [Bartonella sp. F02]|uniref:lytic transglycosylase domain-containing protein n=1 Tax=Bartonella sp. F02 TaxID=2967262 RepID=UPI0022A98303|nr:lytic transglycosylase domain-containing protein [Bartonella sp. F02]MCZ2328774.1 lytic transglycosylase domain-containing protein [Bartonella sp. F02]